MCSAESFPRVDDLPAAWLSGGDDFFVAHLSLQEIINRYIVAATLKILQECIGGFSGFEFGGEGFQSPYWFIENIFNIPGLGSITVASVSARDYPVIQATVLLLTITIVLGNLVSDILYMIIDPRIKSE